MQPKEIIKKMTLLEKAAFLSGKNEWETRDFPRLGIPSLFCADGPNGVRKQEGAGDHLGPNPSAPATCFPTAAATANSWDEELEEALGEALGEEAMEEGVNILLGPGLNIKRNPLCGRNFEYFSEDPYLSGKMAAAFIRGVQKKGAAACAKHFAVNSQELRRMAMNAVVDERTLREIYLTGFEIAVKEGEAKTVMSSYNEINGIYANENRHLLKEILRDEWGFTGAGITDWGGSNDHCAGVKNGSALEMPTPGLDAARELIAGVESGKISETDVDERVEELLTLVLELSGQSKAYKKAEDKQALFQRHHELARKASEGSIVLLKNEEQILPLKKGLRVAVIGDFAFTPRYQGAGSSMVNSTKVDSVKEMLASQELLISGAVQGYQRDGREDDAMRTRPRCIGLWLSDAEHEHLMRQCAATGLNANAHIRKLIMGENLRPRPPDTYAALLRELSAIGNNVNQLAHQANARGEATQEEIHKAARLVREAVQLVRDTL